MAPFPEIHLAPDRFAGYIQELREFSDTHRVGWGKPEDLSQLSEALRSSQGFATDFGSMIRSVVFREHLRASESDLLMLVTIAWGGEISDDSMPQLPSVIQELRKNLREVTRRGISEASTIPIEGPDTLVNTAPDVREEIRELEELSPDVQMYRQFLKIQYSTEDLHGGGQNSDSAPGGAPGRNGAPVSSGAGSKPLDFLHSYGGGDIGETENTSRLDPSAAEILAAALTGLVVALLLNLGSLPVYRAHVSLYLPSAIAGASNPSADDGGSGSGAARAAFLDEALRSGEVTQRVAEHLLAGSHPNPILRQDALSRGMRDLELGGRETILYADLVAETAQLVKVRHLQSQNLYEVTCDSWSSQFAATFCNEFIDVLNEEPSDAVFSQPATEPVRSVDTAIGPGVQVYPHWYRQGVLGLAVGTLVGILLGFVKRPKITADNVTL